MPLGRLVPLVRRALREALLVLLARLVPQVRLVQPAQLAQPGQRV